MSDFDILHPTFLSNKPRRGWKKRFQRRDGEISVHNTECMSEQALLPAPSKLRVNSVAIVFPNTVVAMFEPEIVRKQ